MRGFIAALAAILTSLPALAGDVRIAIIIDDLGYGHSVGQRAVMLPGPVAVAVLPAAPQATRLAKAAHANGKEVLVHLPLQAMSDDGLEEPDSIALDTSRKGFEVAFEQAVHAVPHARGVNNHRGSLLTRHPGHMRWLMEEIRDRNDWYFVDSFTTHHSVALRIAKEHGLRAAKRDVFLDGEREPASIAREFERLKSIARQNGSAIGIGHPYPETLEFLERALPALKAEGIELVALGDLLEAPASDYHLRLAPASIAAKP